VLEHLGAAGRSAGLTRPVDAPVAALARECLLQRDVDLEQVDRLKRWRLV
jgi:hypothetical protein